jgi:hypothetical protein
VLAKLKALWTRLKSNASDLWAGGRWFVAVLGVIVVVLKFKDLLVDFLVDGAKSIFNNTTKQTNDLNNQENQNNESADQLVDDAKKLPDQEPPVSDGWNTKK